MAVNDEGIRVKRFKVCFTAIRLADQINLDNLQHQSHSQALKDVHLPSALSQSKFDHDITV
jgi:hypothetical protein